MDKTRPLTALDYINLPTVQLVRHPDYNPETYRIVSQISVMNTEEINRLVIIGGK